MFSRERRPRPSWLAREAAFFFFFAAPTSPDFEEEAFRAFCAACFRLRAKKPTLTVAGLRALLVVAAAREPLTFEEFARRTRQGYNSAAIQGAQLAEGRGSMRGLRLLKRIPGKDRRQTLLVPSRLGAAVACLFCKIGQGSASSPKPDAESSAVADTYLDTAIIPALGLVTDKAPDLALGTFCVLLFSILNSQRFGHFGEPSSIISREIGISNLPKHLENLSDGSVARPGFGFIELRKYDHNRRIVHPVVTARGLKLLADFAAILRHKDPSPVLRPREDRLGAAASPQEVVNFSEDDFEKIDLDFLE